MSRSITATGSSIELEEITPAIPAPAAGISLPTKAVTVPTVDSASLHHVPSTQYGRVGASAAEPSRFETAIVITLVTMITGLGSLITGVVTTATPTIAKDVHLDQSLLLWPASIYSLVSGCTLLICGSLSDVVGYRFMYLAGCLLQGVFNLASGLARNGGELIAFRGLAGLAISFCLPSATSVITNTFPPGQKRNIAFASMGGGQPIGFALGLTLGGVFAGTIGWRWGFFLPAILNLMLFALSWFVIPVDERSRENMLARLVNDIDWVGAILASTSLAMLSYVFASITSSTTTMSHPTNIVLLTLSLLLLPIFHLWVSRQERLRHPALIPPSLWRSPVFTSICICVFMTWGGFNALEQLLSFYFQYVQALSPIQTALRFLAEPAAGIAANVAAGLLVQRVRGDLLVGASTALGLVSPLVMAVAKPQSSYWAAAFPAMMFNPAGADVLFTVSNLIITERFPARTQGLAGGVFQTVSQVGKAVGLALSAVVANSITEQSRFQDKDSPDALMIGYRAAWWFCFGLSAVTLAVGVLGLRKVGKVGEKKD